MTTLARVLIPFVLALGAFALLSAPATGRESAGACRVVAEGPFLYVDIVIPVTSVQCDSPQRRIRVVTTLTRDGVAAASSRRDCRNASVCYLDIDASAPDADGNQVWCTHVTGYVDSRFIGEATACEADEF